ncbi:endolytic transglycosylase MltG [Streptococcus hongkongensis]|nr:aminodeoxychorismate lyase [Streptococcus uberis]
MTDHKDDEQPSQAKFSFKEQILAELEKANQIRKEKEEELHQKGLREDEVQQKEIEARQAARRTAELYYKYQKETESQPVSPNNEQTPIGDGQEKVDYVEEKGLEKESLIQFLSKENTASNKKQDILSESSFTNLQGSEDEDNSANDLVIGDEENDLSKTIPFTPLMANDFDPTGMTTENQTTVISNDEVIHHDYSSESNQSLNGMMDETPNGGGGLVKNKRVKRQHVNKLANKISLIIIAGVVVIMLLVAIIGTTYVYSAVNPVDKTDTKYVQVEIPNGSGNKLIGQVLEKNGLIKNSTVFSFYTKFKNYGNFQSGYYNLQKSMSMSEIAKALQKGGTSEPSKPVLGKVLIPEGYSIRQMAKAIENNVNTKSTKDKTPFSADTFLKVVSDDAFIKEMVKKYPRLLSSIPKKSDAVYQLEGYLYPATYNYYKNSSEKEMVDQMLATTDATLANYYDQIAKEGKTVNEVLTLASLVEKEGSTDEDRRNIASVFYNRLNNGMALQSNIAILYAMGKLGDKTSLAEDASIDTTIKSPYNIYTNTGLMPGPVDSPGLSAIEATIKPAHTDYLYFVANVKTGEVYYAKTYEQHSANVEKYVNSQIQ